MSEAEEVGSQDDPPESQPDPGLVERLNVEEGTRWIYLDGHRGLLSGWLLVCVFAASLLLIRVDLVTPAEAGDVTELAGALIGGTLPFITVVLAINQLILSEEFGTTGTFFERLEELPQDVHVARQYFKTVHMQQELADLSKVLLYVGFPTLLGGGFVILAYDNLLALDLHPYVYALAVSATITALFSPFAVLIVYVLRIATVTRRIAADFGPFVLQRGLPDDEPGAAE